jgi:16S rRNA processing protein RimM
VTIAASDLIAVGAIVKAFGIKGEVLIEPLTDVPERFRSLQRVYLAPELPATGSATGAPVPTELETVKINRRRIRARFACAQDRTAAQTLVGLLVMIPPEETIALPPGTFFVHQLVGCSVVDEQGTRLGTLTDVLRYPAHDVYVISGAGEADFLVPAVHEFVRSIDTATRTITLHVIEGMRA